MQLRDLLYIKLQSIENTKCRWLKVVSDACVTTWPQFASCFSILHESVQCWHQLHYSKVRILHIFFVRVG